MSRLREENLKPADVVAILTADIHLSLRPPVARSSEPSWFAAMARPLEELGRLAWKYFDAPVIYAGDIFDRWNSPPELVNFALTNLPQGYAIPGNHDLPLHNYEDRHKSAYWTLVQAGVLLDLSPGLARFVEPIEVGGMQRWRNNGLKMFAFPCGFPPSPKQRVKSDELTLAVVHRYIWSEGHAYAGVERAQHVKQQVPSVKGYTAAVFGDNHKGFLAHGRVFNCGSLMRRNIDQRDYRPMVGLLTTNGDIVPHYLDVSEDRFSEVAATARELMGPAGFEQFVEELEKLEDSSLDFPRAMRMALRKTPVDENTKLLLLRALEADQ